MPEDKTIEEMYSELEKEKKSRESSFLKKMSPTMRLGVGLLFGVIAYYMFIAKYDMTKSLVIFVIILGVIWVATQGGQSRELTDQEIKTSLFKQLRFKQLHPLGDHYEVPPGRVKIGMPTVKRWMEGVQGAWRWETSFSIIRTDGLEESYSAEIDPYDGNIISIIERPEGFDGKGTPHIKWIETPEERAQRRYYDRGGKKK